MNEPLDSRQLRAFLTLARTGSFTVAARELFLSQSAVSHSMKSLEEDVGCRLFDRVGKKVLLTQAGEEFLHRVEKILADMEATRAALSQMGKWGRGRLRLGASTSACNFILPPVLREFKVKFPQYLLNIEPADTPLAIDLLKKNRIDLALILEPDNEEQFDFHPLFTDELVFLLDPKHPWAQAGQVKREEIPCQNYILYSKNSFTFRLVADYFLQEKMVLNTIMEVGSMEATKEFVKLGLGVSVLAPWIAQKELADKSLVALPLGKRKLKRTWGLCSWRGRRLNLAEETFLNLCRDFTRKISAGGAVPAQAARIPNSQS